MDSLFFLRHTFMEVPVMQDMIAQIVEMDQKARQITEEAQKNKIQSEQEILQRREVMREEYLSRARRRLKQNEEAEREMAEEALRRIEERNETAAKALEALYDEQGEGWVQTLVNRVLED
jgi:hypothetical protein